MRRSRSRDHAHRAAGSAACRDHAELEIQAIAANGNAETDQTIAALRALLTGLKAIEQPKTMVLVTEGFVMTDQQPSMVEIGNLAVAARTSIYAMRLDDQAVDITLRAAPTAPFADRAARS